MSYSTTTWTHDGGRILLSYHTPVAYHPPSATHVYVVHPHVSATTRRHVENWLASMGGGYELIPVDAITLNAIIHPPVNRQGENHDVRND